uniref:Uncharacterized protein n=1 Tax=Romanomermis culicivorax TaxID=13658 RepID=A0A915JJS3_ROMCU
MVKSCSATSSVHHSTATRASRLLQTFKKTIAHSMMKTLKNKLQLLSMTYDQVYWKQPSCFISHASQAGGSHMGHIQKLEMWLGDGSCCSHKAFTSSLFQYCAKPMINATMPAKDGILKQELGLPESPSFVPSLLFGEKSVTISDGETFDVLLFERPINDETFLTPFSTGRLIRQTCVRLDVQFKRNTLACIDL